MLDAERGQYSEPKHTGPCDHTASTRPGPAAVGRNRQTGSMGVRRPRRLSIASAASRH